MKMKIKKEMKKFSLGILLILVSLSFVAGDFTVGDDGDSYSVETSYGPSQPIIGWINISLEDEPADSLLTAFDSNMSLKDFLDANLVSYSCYPGDCESSYVASGSGSNSKTFTLYERDTALLGIRLTGELSGVSGIAFEVSTNAGRSCLNPLKIDVLNDGGYEWKAENVSNNFSCYVEKPYGCYAGAGTLVNISDKNLYCERITVPPVKGFKIGAVVTGEGVAELEMSIDGNKCDVSVTESGKIGCEVILDEAFDSFTEVEVCIKAKEGSEEKYNVKYEDYEPCGYSEIDGEQFPHDFEIYVEAARYESVPDFIFDEGLFEDEGNLAESIWSYISGKYGGNCTPECMVPFGFYGGINQEVTISNLMLNYTITGLPRSESKFYNIGEAVPIISMDFEKLYLEKANLLVPSDFDDEDMVLRLGGNEIFRKEIKIKAVPEIVAVIPAKPSALVPVNFIVLLKKPEANLSYTWNFGDGTAEQTSLTNSIKHTYPKMDSYNLTVKVTNRLGTAVKSLKVNAIAPKQAINNTLKDYKANLKKVRGQINALPGWVQNEIKKRVDLDYFEDQIKKQEAKYNEAITDEEYIKVMEDLLMLRIPNNLDASQIINPMNFFQSKSQLDLETLEILGAGGYEGEVEKYFKAINNWMGETLNISFESKTYTFYFEDGEETLFSHVKLILNPKENLEEFYVVINADPSELKFKDDLNTKDMGEVAVGIIFPELTDIKTVEFLHPDKIDFLNLPIYISPEFVNLELEAEVGVCNSNNKCDRSLGENYKNCRVDCKPVTWTIILLGLLVFVALGVYIGLQEWYKRRYEGHLFPDKSQLFNLINFINNSSNQGMTKTDIISQLKGLDWKGEQLNYAWRKLHGERTGMWEIPIFKWIENRKVEKELEKRQGSKVKGPPQNI